MNLRTILLATVVGIVAGASMMRAAPTQAAEGAVAPSAASGTAPQDITATATPIKHLVVIFNENVSFDHYFATYPTAANPPGEPTFTAAPGTPQVNNLVTAKLLTHNPNATNKENGTDAAEPFRLDRTQAATASQDHT
jgi:phospholipase C